MAKRTEGVTPWLPAAAGGVAFGGLGWLVGDRGAGYALTTGLVFFATWLLTSRLTGRRRGQEPS